MSALMTLVHEFRQRTCDSAPELALCGFDIADLELEAGEDWEAIHDRPEALAQFAMSLREDQQIRAGIVPERWTGTATCAKCGEVWVPPHLAGWKMAGCRWCSVRRAGRAIHKASLSTDPSP